MVDEFLATQKIKKKSLYDTTFTKLFQISQLSFLHINKPKFLQKWVIEYNYEYNCKIRYKIYLTTLLTYKSIQSKIVTYTYNSECT